MDRDHDCELVCVVLSRSIDTRSNAAQLNTAISIQKHALLNSAVDDENTV